MAHLTDHEDAPPPLGRNWADWDTDLPDVTAPEEYELRLREQLRIDPELLEEEFLTMGQQVAAASGSYARAMGAHLRAKAGVRRLRGLVDLQVRQRAVSGNVKMTEAMVAAHVDQDVRVVAMEDQEIQADVEREKAKGRLAAMMAKKDCCVQLGAARRAELEGNPILRTESRNRRRAQEG
jgi:hypothetical protein